MWIVYVLDKRHLQAQHRPHQVLGFILNLQLTTVQPRFSRLKETRYHLAFSIWVFKTQDAQRPFADCNLQNLAFQTFVLGPEFLPTPKRLRTLRETHELAEWGNSSFDERISNGDRGYADQPGSKTQVFFKDVAVAPFDQIQYSQIHLFIIILPIEMVMSEVFQRHFRHPDCLSITLWLWLT